MNSRSVVLAVGLLLIGLLVGNSSPIAKAQPVGDPCAAPWTIESGRTGDATYGTYYAIKLNRCTGEVLVLADSSEGGNTIIGPKDENKTTVWRKFPTQ